MSDDHNSSSSSAKDEPQAPSYRMRPTIAPGIEALLPGAICETGFAPKPSGQNSVGDEFLPRSTPIWPVLAGVIAVVLFMAGAIFILWQRATNEPIAEVRPVLVPETTFDAGQAKDWKGPVPKQIAEAFTQATTNEERLKWVREPERVAPIMERFFRDGPGASEKHLGIVPMKPGSNGELAFQRFQVRTDDGGSRLLCVVLTDDGGKVDFECYARHGSATWEELLSGEAAEDAEVRVFIEPGFAYMYEYADEQKWSSYLATTPDYEYPLNFYAMRGSDEDKKLQNVASDRAARVTLKIRSVKNSHEKKQFEVSEVISSSWVR